MCPGMRPATGWIAYLTSTPWALSVSPISRKRVGLRNGHAVSGDDNHFGCIFHDKAASSADPIFAALSDEFVMVVAPLSAPNPLK